MRLPDLAITGWMEITAHKMRSFLSFFAIAIGIATFFYTLSVLSQKYRQINISSELSGAGRLDTSTRHNLTVFQYKDLMARLPYGSSLSFTTNPSWLGSWNRMEYNGQSIVDGQVIGILPTWKDSNFVYRLEGRFFNWQDIENKHRAAIITVFPHEKEERNVMRARYRRSGSDQQKNEINLKDFTERHHLLGQQIMLGGHSFTVVGLLHVPTRIEDYRFPDEQEHASFIYLPYTTWQDLYASERGTDPTQIRVITGKESLADTASKTLYSFLRAQFGTDEKPVIKFFYEKLQQNMKDARKSLNNMLFMGIIAMIAGGIGIMNVTMAVISSRTKEIGIRRALGASRKDILFQFLVEAMLLGLCGSFAGMFLGYLAVLQMAENIRQMTFSWWVVAGSIIIALFTSFIFALYPAWQAAKLNPVDALKHE